MWKQTDLKANFVRSQSCLVFIWSWVEMPTAHASTQVESKWSAPEQDCSPPTLVLRTCHYNPCGYLNPQDAVTLAVMKEHEGEYGKQRFFFIMGMATMSPLAGYLVDSTSEFLGQ